MPPGPQRGSRATPRLPLPAQGVSFAGPQTGRSRPRGESGASCLLSARLARRRLAEGWGELGNRRMRLLPWAAAPHAASSIVATNASSGGRAPRRCGRCIPPLAAAAAAAAPRPRAEHPRALPGLPATLSWLLSPQESAQFFVPLTCSLASARLPLDAVKGGPSPAVRLQPRLASAVPASPELSVEP